ncbi:MAG: hypothetical protein IJS01_00700 [Lentisphaeria bacterium]|nr:hypothetical protein [Lentisphaeria bacterium]
MRSFFLLILACLSTVLGAFDRDFSVRGDGREAPRQLDVFRRGRGYVIALESREEAFVSLSFRGERRLVLDTEKEVFRIRAEKPVFVWYVPDKDSRFADQDIVGIDCRFKKGRIHLPGRNAFPLTVSGRKGRQYSWNDEEGTILEQVSNSRVCFQDASFDVIGPCCGDLIDGSAEVENGLLRLEARLREKADCDMRVLIDSVPERGYIGDGADFLLNNHRLSRFSGENPNQWKWENFSTVKFEKEGNTYRWSLPLELIRAGGGGRLRLRFQSLCRSCRNSGGITCQVTARSCRYCAPGTLRRRSPL